MVTPVDYPAPAELFSKAVEVRIPFSDVVKYCILGVSVTFLLLALGILAWQFYRCCAEKHTTYTQQDTVVHNDLLYSEEKTTGNYSGTPNTKLEDVSTETHRLSRCLSQASFPSSESIQAAGVKEEQAAIQQGDCRVRVRHLPGEHLHQDGLLSICAGQTCPIHEGSTSQLEDLQALKELLLTSWCQIPKHTFRGGVVPRWVDGSLRFSVYCDQMQSRLVVTVLQVEGLSEHNRGRSLQPFVKILLMWAGSEAVEVEGFKNEQGEAMPPVMWTVLQEWRTRIVKGSCNPLFGDQFSCVLQEDMLHHITLRMEVRDFDKFSRHTVLGEVKVPLGQLSISYPLELQEDLQIPQKDLVGEVLLSLRFLPTAQRLEVGLLKVRAVFAEISSDAALYARISVQCNQCKLKYQKTSAVARCLLTVFNEVFLFSLPEVHLERCKILVSVYETHTASKSVKQLIGQLSVAMDKSSENEHWTLMMRSVRQPVAKWHGLLI